MKLTLKYNLIILFILIAVNYTKAQNDSKNQFDYAEQLYNHDKYYDAITEYKRLLFFDTSGEYSFAANLKIGLCYRAGAKLDEAIKYFSIAEMNTNDIDQKYRASIEIVRSNILRKTTDRAMQVLDEMEKSELYNTKLDSLNYWRGWAYMFADDWQSASKTFAKYPSFNNLRFICDGVINKKVSVTFATVISYILPGSGQIYTGNYLSGLMSLGYNVLFGYLTINAFNADRVFDGTATGLLLWLRFYRGNIQNAKKFAEEKNINIANAALNDLQKNYQGMKP